MESYSVIDEATHIMELAKEFDFSPKKLSVVIPFFNNWTLTHARLMEIWRHVYVHEVILINDASTEPNIDTSVAWWQHETDLPLVYIKNKENLGFGKSMNKGIWTATGEVVVLLSNDVVITGDFSLDLFRKLEPKTLIGNTLYRFNTGWNTFDMPDGSRLFPYLGGYFLAAYKQDFIELGGFDDIYGKFDVEDLDLSTTALFLNYDLVALNSPFLKHLSGQTVRKNYPDREKYTNENREKFYQKWKKILYEDTGKFSDNHG